MQHGEALAMGEIVERLIKMGQHVTPCNQITFADLGKYILLLAEELRLRPVFSKDEMLETLAERIQVQCAPGVAVDCLGDLDALKTFVHPSDTNSKSCLVDLAAYIQQIELPVHIEATTVNRGPGCLDDRPWEYSD